MPLCAVRYALLTRPTTDHEGSRWGKWAMSRLWSASSQTPSVLAGLGEASTLLVCLSDLAALLPR
ncbi:hypothetical protein BRAS3843_1060037 [Bradyrhizobium sp. STM 3843]|nr:hypothetical protein BRAS3843_1060037 [Bradyrhizobium sp. STM 3843]